jgi:phospholipase C
MLPVYPVVCSLPLLTGIVVCCHHWQLDNFDDNAFEWFTSFHNAAPGSPLFDNGILPVWDIVEAFADLVSRDALPSGLSAHT